ncbi:MAG: class I SAM-dependent methyltransferase [Cyclobacteriaceae bacterium]
MIPSKSSEKRIADEREFHDEIFSSQARRSVGKFYSINEAIEAAYDREIFDSPMNKTVLEYGCGMGTKLIDLDKLGARTYGIDISEYAIHELRQLALKKSSKATYQVMNAEDLQFDDRTFDIIYGSGILHHLDLAKAFETIGKKLKDTGKAVFIEPLGHNPLINGFRKKTPTIRTEDEHPLLMNDLKDAGKFFGRITVKYYYLSTLALPLIFGHRSPSLLIKTFNGIDRLIFGLIPVLRKHAWQVLIKLEAPRV